VLQHYGVRPSLSCGMRFQQCSDELQPLPVLQHKLFFITHPVPGTAGQIHIYDEKGNLIRSLTGINMGPGGVYVALNPSTRTGFVQTSLQNGGSGLQSFSY
jgi:hypothetical protein